MSKVDKYRMDWQVFRASLKGLSWEEKEVRIGRFAEGRFNHDYKDIIVNYIKGCAISLKGEDKRKAYAFLASVEAQPSFSFEVEDSSIGDYNIEDVYKTFVDLHARNKRWLKKGYIHQKQNEFMENLLSYLGSYKNSNRYREEFFSLRERARYIANTHTFFF